jgi:D-xylose 1-dehydrogenase (NADP+, D-xylono-1,5-lactone-forming)
MIRWGFLGAGSIAAGSLAPAVHATEDAELYAVATRDPTRAEALGPKVTYSSYDDVIADSNVDIVYVNLHNSAHARWTERALAAGKDVLCEKPLGLGRAEVTGMVAAAEQHQRILVEACWNRWHERTRESERLIASGTIGAVRRVTATFRGARPPEGNYRYQRALGGGALLDVGCYALSATLAAFGWRQPHRCSAQAQSWYPGSADETTSVALDFDSGAAVVTASLSGAAEEVLEIVGEAGRIRLAERAFTAGVDPSTLVVETAAGSTVRRFPAQNPYQTMVAEIGAAMRGQAAYLVPLDQSLAVAAVLELIQLSIGEPT